MNTTPLLSIIVPVYNVERYLDECLDSIARQSFTNWECILVDDGSTDSSFATCEAWAQKDDRFRAFHKENGGQSSARNLALTHARGKYIMFIDSDDSLLSDDLVDRLVSEIELDCTNDFVQYPYKSFCEENELLGPAIGDNPVEFDGTKDILNAFSSHRITTFVWDKIFRRSSILVGLTFPEGVYYEDERYLIDYLTKANRGKIANIGYYRYRLREGSTTHQNFDLRHAMDLFKKDFHGAEAFSGIPSCNDTYLAYYASAYREYLNAHRIARKEVLRDYRAGMRRLAPKWGELLSSNYSTSAKLGIAIIKVGGLAILELIAQNR